MLESSWLSSISEVAFNHHGSKEDSLPYSPRLLASFSHSKSILFFKCFTNCLFIGCKDQVRFVYYVIIIFLYILNYFSFVNYHHEENKLRKKFPCLWSLSNTSKRPNNHKLQIEFTGCRLTITALLMKVIQNSNWKVKKDTFSCLNDFIY